MLGAVLLGGEEPLDVALGRLGRAGDRAEAGAAVLAGDEPLGRGADERDPVELEQEQVRRRVDAPERPVDVERRAPRSAARPAARERTGRRRPRRCAPSPTRPSRCSGRDRASAGSGRACRAALGARRCPTRGARRSPPASPASTSATPAPWSKRTSVSHDDHAALREAAALLGQRHRRLEPRDVVVGEIADDRQPEPGRLVEVDDARAGSHPRVAPEPAPLDRFEDEARPARIAQAQVGRERGEEVGVDRRRHRCRESRSRNEKDLRRGLGWRGGLSSRSSARSRIAVGATTRCGGS